MAHVLVELSIPMGGSRANSLEGGISYRTLVLNTRTPFEDFTNHCTRVLWRAGYRELETERNRLGGKGKVEARALAGLRGHPDPAGVVVQNLLTDRQADAVAGILLAAVKPLEHHENAIPVLRVDSDAVVLH